MAKRIWQQEKSGRVVAVVPMRVYERRRRGRKEEEGGGLFLQRQNKGGAGRERRSKRCKPVAFLSFEGSNHCRR